MRGTGGRGSSCVQLDPSLSPGHRTLTLHAEWQQFPPSPGCHQVLSSGSRGQPIPAITRLRSMISTPCHQFILYRTAFSGRQKASLTLFSPGRYLELLHPVTTSSAANLLRGRVCYTVPGTAEDESGFKDSRPTTIPYQIYIQHPNIRFQDRTLRCFRWR